ncbi:MAG: hypothetical protein DRP02_02410 [Candidatus Gerdarchaeota archaeon]|nr:MAG: hypothetical protein DRP02_02410 [Candidatus Gerdarchaeota archaeon]
MTLLNPEDINFQPEVENRKISEFDSISSEITGESVEAPVAPIGGAEADFSEFTEDVKETVEPSPDVPDFSEFPAGEGADFTEFEADQVNQESAISRDLERNGIPQEGEPSFLEQRVRSRGGKFVEALKRGFPEGGTPREILSFLAKSTMPLPLQVDPTKLGKETPAETAIQAGGQVAGLVGDIAFKTISDIAGAALPEDLKQAFGVVGGEVAETETFQSAIAALESSLEDWEKFAEKNPRIAGNVEGLIGLSEVVPVAEMSIGTLNLFKKSAPKFMELLKKSPRAAKELVDDAKVVPEFAEMAAEQRALDLEKRIGTRKGKRVQEKIKEPETARTAREALGQGRVDPAKRGFWQKVIGGKKGKIIPTEEVDRATDVILRDIAKPDTSNPQKLFNQVKDTGIQKAKKLKPKLQKIPVDDTARGQIDDAIKIMEEEVLKDERVFSLLSGKEKKAITRYVEDLKNAKNLDEIWEARTKYDRSVPKNTKQATDLSDSTLQDRQTAWLDSRRHGNKILKEATEGLEDISIVDDFADMSSLFEVRQNMIQRAPELLKPEKGIFTRKNLIKAGLGAGGAKLIFD